MPTKLCDRMQLGIIIFSLTFTVLILPSIAASDSAGNIFKKASALYMEGKYDDALKQYDSLLKEGYESGNLYYNMANCYIKKSNIGYAILYYEKAKRLIPSDADLRANHDYAVSLTKNRQTATVQSWINRQLDRVYNLFTTNGLTIFLSLLYTLITTVLTISIYNEKAKKYAGLIILTAALLLLPSSYILYERISSTEAVVVNEKAEARYEPFDKATVFFTLYEGMKVVVIDRNNHWLKVKRSDGKTGWIHNDSIGVI
ncbi:MAG: SH3 domain-containing protein [Nitrospirae bacterium YQR-1]